MSLGLISLRDAIGLVGAVLALTAGVVAAWQLGEVRQRRRVDMYWKLFDVFTSDDIKDSASAFDAIERRLELQPFNALGQAIPSPQREKLADQYWTTFYEAERSSDEKTLDRLARARLRFYVQTGVLTRAKLVDRDLLFGLIGPALDVDYTLLDIIVAACRIHHGFPEMFKEVQDLNKQYKAWSGARRSEAPAPAQTTPGT